MWAMNSAFEPGSRGGLMGARGRVPTPSPKSLSRPVPRASQPPASIPRALAPHIPPVDAPWFQVSQRPLVKPEHLLLVGQIGRWRQERHDGRLTFSVPGGSRETGCQRRGGGAAGRAGRYRAVSASVEGNLGLQSWVVSSSGVRICQHWGHFGSRASRTAARGPRTWAVQLFAGLNVHSSEEGAGRPLGAGNVLVLSLVLASPVCLFVKIDELRSYDFCSFQHVVVFNKKEKKNY